MREQYCKKLLKEILENQFEDNSNFKTDCNLPNYQLIEEVKNFLNDFIMNDTKQFKIEVYFVQGKQYNSVVLSENAETKFIFEIDKKEFMLLSL